MRTSMRVRLITVMILLPMLMLGSVNKLGIPDLQNFNRRQYRAGTQNWGLSQSHSDLLYFANNDGLLEYDGERWHLHKVMGEAPVRSVNCVNDKIYVGSFNEFGFFQYDSLLHLQYHSLADTFKVNEPSDIWDIHTWGKYIVFRAEKALYVFEEDHLRYVIPAVGRFISSFLVNEMLLVQDEAQGLLEVRGDQVFPVAGGQIFKGKIVASAMALSSRQIVLGTMKNGLFSWNMETIVPWNVQANQHLMQANIFCGHTCGDRYLAFGTIQDGLVVTDKQGHLVAQLDKDKGLLNNTVLSLLEDKEGNIWCGLDNGISRVNLQSGISFLSGYYNLGTGYVMERFHGQYYFGTNQALFTISDGPFHDPLKDRDDFQKVAGTEGQVWSLFSDGDEVLCGHDQGVLRIVDNRSELITPVSVNGVWKFISIPEQPNLMLAGTYKGFILLHKKSGRWLYSQRVEGFGESSRFAQWDEQGCLWVSHGNKGIYQVTFSADYKEVVKSRKFDFSHFPDNKTGLVCRLKGQLFFVGTDCIYLIERDGRIRQTTEFDRFFSKGQYPRRMFEDQYRNIWFFTNSKVGVLRYLEDASYTKIEYPFLPLEQKMVSAFESVFVLNDENVFFGVEDGFVHYHLSGNAGFRMPFKVHLRSFKGTTDSIPYMLHQQEDDGFTQYRVPEYPFKNNAFEIHYAASFYQDEGVEYATFLSGVDKEPTAWSSVTFRQFTKLREGEYTFTVYAKNRYNVEARPVHFSFIVKPPWYRQIPAKIAYFIAALLLVITMVYFFNRRIELSRKREKLKQRERYKAREEQLTNEALRTEKEMVKLRNEKLRDEMLFKEKELANSTMNIIQKNEFLLSVKDVLSRIKKLNDAGQMAAKLEGVIKKINKDIDSDSHWEVFELHLEQIHADFINRLKIKHPDLTGREQKLCAYIRMNMTSKEIATLMNVSYRAIENNRYRLRQKLGLASGDNLSKYINDL
ncbi:MULTISPECIES: two-component regulator propeller domain-containing protein [unclassified Carboxylicivirga]|uniref:helix-turn-helix and ligand-binding sensor domain-containing protein n=1 Tax=Carboxylicivirga TaxID=1628153 RepID=UPI003D353948